MRAQRYADNDHHKGPFTYGKTDRNAWQIVLDSGRGGYDGKCHLRLTTSRYYLLIDLPQIIKPGRPPGDYEDHPREYGFSLSTDSGGHAGVWFFQFFYGLQTWSSATTQSWSCFVPWTDWRHVRRSLYDLEGKHFYSEMEADRKRGHQWGAMQAVVKACPQAVFEFDDYDGKRIQARTRMEEREWRFGTKWCKWLSLFRKPMIRRSLDIDFSEEVGPEKGSWKGGTTGHGIEMLPGEDHEAAFRRYCEQEQHSKYRNFKITYVGRVA